MKETQKHIDAFEVWFNGGEPLSYTETVQRLNESRVKVSRTSIATWSKAFGWFERRDKRLAELKSNLDTEVVDELTRQKKQMIAVVDMALVRIQQALVGGVQRCPSATCTGHAVCSECGAEVFAPKVKLEVKDIEKLIRAKLTLVGEPDSRVDLTSGGASLLDVVRMAIEK